MNRKIKVVSVCGSGTVSSSMVSQKIKELLKKHGYKAEAVEVNPQGLDLVANSGDIDLIFHTCPVKKDYGVPKINATGFLTGINEDKIEEEMLNAIAKLK